MPIENRRTNNEAAAFSFSERSAHSHALSEDVVAFKQRIVKKSRAELIDSIAYREKQLRSGNLTGAEQGRVERELAELKVTIQEQERREKPELMRFSQVSLTTESASSSALRENKDAKLNPVREMREYFGRQEKGYMRQLEQLNGQVQEPMGKETEAVVCIPVAGTQESGNIYNTLKSFAEQQARSETFEVLLLVNVPERFAQSKQKELRATISEIARAKRDFPQLKIRNANVILPDDQVKIGNIRKIVTDLAMLRQQRAGNNRDMLLLSNDADNQGISESYIQSYIEYFREHPDKEGAVGNLQFDPNAFVRLPVVQVRQEYATYLDQTGFKNGNVCLFGSNSVMKASIYSAIGGYPTAFKNGEQEWTGTTIRKLRKQKGTLGFVDKAVLTTSSRRGVTEYLEGRGSLGFGDEARETGMRALKLESFPMIDFSKPEAVKKFIAEAEASINIAINAYEQGEQLGKNSWYYRTNLEKVGIVYKVEGDPKDINSRVVITSIDKFVRRQAIMQRAIKAGEKNMAKVYEASLAA